MQLSSSRPRGRRGRKCHSLRAYTGDRGQPGGGGFGARESKVSQVRVQLASLRAASTSVARSGHGGDRARCHCLGLDLSWAKTCLGVSQEILDAPSLHLGAPLAVLGSGFVLCGFERTVFALPGVQAAVSSEELSQGVSLFSGDPR